MGKAFLPRKHVVKTKFLKHNLEPKILSRSGVMFNVWGLLVHYCTLSLSDIWVTRQIKTNTQWYIQRLSRWVTN